MTRLSPVDAESWLVAYGRAWERRDAAAFVALFSPEVRYHWTPFDAPQQGQEAVGEAFRSAVARQEAIRFDFELLAVTPPEALARWRCSFDRVGAAHRVRLDGIFQVELDDRGLCRVFREWWHSDEAGTGQREHAETPEPPGTPAHADERGPPRAIVQFHRDDEGHWVATLACGHTRHMRDTPPWMVRPWVRTPEGRASMVGRAVGCLACAEDGG